MKLKEAVEFLRDYADWVGKLNRNYPDTMGEAIDTVLAELDTRYNKGYQDGFKQAKFDCEMDKLDGRINNVR